MQVYHALDRDWGHPSGSAAPRARLLCRQGLESQYKGQQNQPEPNRFRTGQQSTFGGLGEHRMRIQAMAGHGEPSERTPARTKRMPQLALNSSDLSETRRNLIEAVCDRNNHAGPLLAAPEPIRM